MRRLTLFFLLAVFSCLAFSQATGVFNAVSALCSGLTSLLPVVAMLMVLVGAVVYAAGQLLGAETRARANVWATAALTGAVMGLLISSISPSVLQLIYGHAISCGATSPPPTCGAIGQSCCSGICNSGLSCVSNVCGTSASSSGPSSGSTS